MKSSSLILGRKYHIKYRKFDKNGRLCYGQELTSGVGMLVGIFDVAPNNHHHSFILENSDERVWATANSIIKEVDRNLFEDVSEIAFEDSESLNNISCFLDGIGVGNKVVNDTIVIPFSSVKIFNQLIHKLYSDILEF